jgi:hypothetical protein
MSMQSSEIFQQGNEATTRLHGYPIRKFSYF